MGTAVEAIPKVRRPLFRLPWAISFAAFINALSIPLIAGILIWVLMRVLSPNAWCPVLEEFKVTRESLLAAWRCQPIIMEQLYVGRLVAVGLVGALALSHLVSVVREAKAALEISTKLGSLKMGGPAKDAAEHVEGKVKDAAEDAVADVSGEPKP